MEIATEASSSEDHVERRVNKSVESIELQQIKATQQALISEVTLLKSDICELKTTTQEVVTLFKEGKTVIKFISGAGTLAKWLALTSASIAALYAAFVTFLKS